MLTAALTALSLSAATPAQEPLFERDWTLPHLGVHLHESRWLEPDGRIARRVVDGAGQPVDLDALRRADHAAGMQARGKLAPELLAHLDAIADPTQPVDVVFWLASADAPDWRARIDAAIAAGDSVEDARRAARDEAVLWFESRTRSFARDCAERGWQVTQTLGAWPVVYATLPAGEVRAAAAHPAVDEAYRCFPDAMPEQEHAQATLRTPLVWASGLTATGSPVKTMVNDPGHVTQVNPYLPPVIWIHGGGGAASHASACAGNIAMDDGFHRAAAYGLPQIYSASEAGDTGAPASWNAAISNGVSFGNCSWWNGSKGSIVYLDRFFDYTIRNYAMMMFKSTGNQGYSSTPYTTTPGNGYNSTNSGSYNDGNDFVWAGDAMAGYSSYWDPAEGHEKPELASPGDDVDTTGTSTYYNGFGGTSSASPLTCGVATLMATRDPVLTGKPEVVKAALMASAWHNIEGDDVLSEKDGAGGVHALAADRVVDRGQWHGKLLTAADFANPADAYDVAIPCAAGAEMRLCALWFSTANSAYSTDVLNMDLDMVVLDPAGNPVASSANGLNAFEILKFTPATTGVHTVRLQRQRFDGTSEPFALAWSYRNDTGEARIALGNVPTVGGTAVLEFEARYRPNSWYQAHVSTATLPKVVGLGSGFVLPLANDAVYAQTGALPGMSGNFDASGNAGATLAIPNSPALANRTFHVALYTKESAGATVIKTVSEALPVTVLP